MYLKRHKRECQERNTITTAYTANFVANNDKFPSLSHREHCAVSNNQIEKLGLSLGQQIRILRPTANGTKLALYTITDVHGGDNVDDDEDTENTVLVGFENQDDLHERLRLPDGEDSFKGKIDDQVTAEGLDDDKAETYSEFIEHLCDDGQNSRLIVLAPHGGNIEKYTDEQANMFMRSFIHLKCVSSWICKGFNKKEDGGAFNRWHITSIDISDISFPKLKKVYRRGFEYAVAFHGFSDEKNPRTVCIGGITNDKKLKSDLKTEIDSKNAGIKVYMDKDCPKNINGDNVKNIVNRLSTNALQIEQTGESGMIANCDL